MRTKYKAWAKPLITENKNIACNFEDIKSSDTFSKFAGSDNLYLEIGPGKGAFMLQLAEKNQDKLFLCVEKCETIAGIFAKKLLEAKLENVFIISGDVFDVFPLLSNHSVNAIFLNHPDPWPKKRHEKRRLTSPIFLKEYGRLLKENSPLIFKTDNDDLFSYTLEIIEDNGFKIVEKEFDYMNTDEFDAITDYQQNFIDNGVKIKRLKAIYEEK